MSEPKLNVTPFLGDVAILLVAFFICIIIAQQLTILNTEKTTPIQADAYFESASFELDSLSRANLKVEISKNIFPDMKKSFRNGKLTEISIIGHTDNVSPGDRDGEKWETNEELSLFRANQVRSVLTEILEESGLSIDSVAMFQRIIFTGGKGEWDPLNFIIVENNAYGNGIYDLREPFIDSGQLNNLYDYNELYEDLNGNNVWDDSESFDDLPNGVWDEGEKFYDSGIFHNKIWNSGEAFDDVPNGEWDEGEEFTDNKLVYCAKNIESDSIYKCFRQKYHTQKYINSLNRRIEIKQTLK